MKRIALYARVSTLNNQDPELQLREMRQYWQRPDCELVAEYVDRISSGKVRPNLNRLLADAAEKKFDVVMVWKFDRCARSAIELCQTLELLQGLGITFVSLTEQIDTSTAAGKLVFTVLGAVAEMERSLIRERVRAGLRNAAAKGRHGGRPRTVSGVVSPADVRAAVTHNKGSVARAAAALGISYGWAYTLNQQAQEEKAS